MIRFATLLAVFSSAGCHALLGIDDFSTADASIDVPVPDTFVVDARSCFGTLTRICIAPPALGTIIVAGILNTSSDPRCDVHSQAGGPDLCVIAGGQISIENTLVTGSRALVFIGTGNITVNASLEASSKRGGQTGAGAATQPCAPTQTGQNDPAGAGGGAGGSYGARAGAGGPGDIASGTTGGVAVAPIDPLLVRAGCAGGNGGVGIELGGTGGASGGVIALLSGSQISIIAAGSVYASGAGGGAGTVHSGGGGGGSGGLIVLDAPSIQVLGKVVANGGGGGGGGDSGTGQPGGDGTTTTIGVPATGGAGEDSTHGGPGGNGAALGQLATTGALSPSITGGAGGGGGGTGVIWVHGTLAGGTMMSPAAALH